MTKIREALGRIIRFLESHDPALLDEYKSREKRLSQAALFAVLLLVLVSRRPDCLLNPQFWAEDGRFWYYEAHNFGFSALRIPHAGYIELLQRVAALAVQGLPFRIAPLIFNSSALVARALPAAFLFSPRMRNVFPKPWARWLLAAYIVGVPGSGEVHATLTNAHTHLALLTAMIVLLADPPRGFVARAGDALVLIVSGLSGPFGIALAPLALLRWANGSRFEMAKTEYTKQDRNWLLVQALLVIACAAIQEFVILHVAPLVEARATAAHYVNAGFIERTHGETGASLPIFVDLLGGKVIFAAIIGDTHWSNLTQRLQDIPLRTTLAFIFGASGLFIVLRSLTIRPARTALFTTYCALIFAAALAFPLATSIPNWPLWAYFQQNYGEGNRYWFIPMVGLFTATVAVGAADRSRWSRGVAICLLALAPIGVASDWSFTPWPDTGFRRSVADFDKAMPGTRVSIPAMPSNDWSFSLVKQ